MKFLVINGPNLNLLGLREPGIYGSQSYSDLLDFIGGAANNAGVAVELFQSNHEGAIVDAIQNAYGTADGIVINPAAYTHTSIAILDALKAVALPAVEVHISDITSREAYRQRSYTSEACLKTIAGKGFEGYREAILFLKEHIAKAAD
ncbi:type II 3-dehydroquinate dehydratase [Oscillospiraceae bacterium CM]|nr:type II 3-dehydroquinate dehydratase [Oscillospiraceae bacterium CM]